MCTFLGVDVPNIPFPSENKAKRPSPYTLRKLKTKIKALPIVKMKTPHGDCRLFFTGPANRVIDMSCRLEARPVLWEKPHAATFLCASRPSS